MPEPFTLSAPSGLAESLPDLLVQGLADPGRYQTMFVPPLQLYQRSIVLDPSKGEVSEEKAGSRDPQGEQKEDSRSWVAGRLHSTPIPVAGPAHPATGRAGAARPEHTPANEAVLEAPVTPVWRFGEATSFYAPCGWASRQSPTGKAPVVTGPSSGASG